ncbi:putative ribonuclease H-like domain-containing protein [Tanacetum coccineum]
MRNHSTVKERMGEFDRLKPTRTAKKSSIQQPVGRGEDGRRTFVDLPLTYFLSLPLIQEELRTAIVGRKVRFEPYSAYHPSSSLLVLAGESLRMNVGLDRGIKTISTGRERIGESVTKMKAGVRQSVEELARRSRNGYSKGRREIIEECNSFKPVAQTTTNEDGTSTTTILGVVTNEQKILMKNDLKAQSILTMTLLSEHVLTFNKHKDAKSLFKAIEPRFGGNKATKKTQKTLLKQMYETFNAFSSESLESIFNKLQKIVSQLTILGEIISPEELNLKFLRSLPTEWGHSTTNDVNTANVHVSTGSTPVSTASTNNSTACLSDAIVYAYLATQPNGSQVVHEDLEQIHEDDLDEMDLKWQLALLSMKARKFYQRTGKKIIINGSDTAGYDKKKVECFNCHKLGHFARE